MSCILSQLLWLWDDIYECGASSIDPLNLNNVTVSMLQKTGRYRYNNTSLVTGMPSDSSDIIDTIDYFMLVHTCILFFIMSKQALILYLPDVINSIFVIVTFARFEMTRFHRDFLAEVRKEWWNESSQSKRRRGDDQPKNINHPKIIFTSAVNRRPINDWASSHGRSHISWDVKIYYL